MKRVFSIIVFFFFFQFNLSAQELPVFSQKFNNGLVYNPSLAGVNSGAVDLSYQRQWSGLDRSLTNLYAGLQNHFAQGRIGVAANLFRENFNLLSTNFITGSVAYHLPFGNNSGISFGVSAEYANVALDIGDARITQENDPLINNFPGYNNIDFGFGFTLSLQDFQVGASSVRFTQFLNTENSQEQDYFPAMFTSFAAYRFLLADGSSWLEPRVHYRFIENQANILDAGLYFTYGNLVTAGASYRNNSTISASAAIHLQDLTIAYSRQSLTNEYSSNLGGSDEITLRYTFNENLNFFGGTRGSRRGRLGGRGFNNAPGKLMNRNAKKPKSNLSDRKERMKMRNYKGKYRRLLKKSKRN